jgi:hypothetical protein
MMKGAFVDDPETKRKIYAEGLFPDLPPEEGMKGIGYEGGEMTFYDPSKSPLGMRRQYAKPGGLSGFLKSFSAEQPAYLPHEIMGTVGALGGPWTAGLGVAGGEGIRKSIGALAFDEPQTVTGNVASMGASGLLGGYLPAKAGQFIGKRLQRGVVRDIDRLDPAGFSKTSELSKRFDIPLTVAEKTNLPSLKGYQTALNNISDSADDLAKFYQMRGDKVDIAVSKALNKISRVDSVEDAADLAKKAALGAKARIKEEMKQKARPLYESAYQSGPVDITDVVKTIDDDIARYPKGGKIARGLEKAKRFMLKETDDGMVPNDSLESLDYAKQEIDDLIESAKRTGNNRLVARLTQNKNGLSARMDEVSPDYAAARKIWTEGSDALEKIDSTAVKIIANLPEEKYQTAAARMFNPKTTGPNAIAKAKSIIAKENPEAWDALVRGYIESAWDDAGRATTSKGATFRRLIFGDAKKRASLKAAMSPEQFNSFSDLMDVLDATGRVKQVGSDTAYKQEIIRELNEKWGAGWNDVARPMGWIRENLSRARIGKNAKQMAEILTTQDGVESIKLIKQLKPGSQERINALAVLLGIAATEDDDVSGRLIPPAMQQERQ